MNNNVNNAQGAIAAPISKQEVSAHNDKSVSIVPSPRTIEIGDTTVRLSFSESGDFNTRLASAFNSMLK